MDQRRLDLNDFMQAVASTDSNVRIEVYQKLEEHLRTEKSSLDSENFSKFIDAIQTWITCSHFKICINGMTIMCLFVERLGDKFRNHTPEIMTVIIDRLADSKEPVKEAAKNTLLFFMEAYTTTVYF